MNHPSTQKMHKKSAVWHKHGKHSKIDPALIRREWKRRPGGKLYDSIAALFRAERSKR